MSESSSLSLGRWLAGIAATVISAIIIWLLTRPGGLLNPLSPTSKPDVVSPTTRIVISQTEGLASAAFGDSDGYVSVGEGQSFAVKKTATIKEIQIYLEVSTGYAGTDQIICDLRNRGMAVLESSSIAGFSSGGGWQTIAFNTRVDPGTYLFTCYLLNHSREKHDYAIGGNANDNSYLEGTRYVSTGGHPEDASTWGPWPWDLKFKIKMDAGD